MNRFSKDIGAMDDILAITFLNAMTLLSNIVAVILLTICVNVWIVVPHYTDNDIIVLHCALLPEQRP